jgi:hypothetical protein
MTTTYSVTRDQIIVAALRKCGAIEPADTSATIDQDILTNTAQALNIMVKAWATVGIKLWTVVEQVVPLVANQTSYVIGPVGPGLIADKPMKLVQAWIRNTQATPDIDTPLQILSQQEYNVLGSKFSTGIANSIYLNPGVTSSTVKLFLTPDIVTATNYELHIVVQIQLADMTTGATVPDFPNEWYLPLVWGLADQIAIEFDMPGNHRQEIQLRAAKYLEGISDASIDAESTLFTPNFQAANAHSSYY